MWRYKKPTKPGYYWMSNYVGVVKLVEIWESDHMGMRMTDLKGMTGAMLGVVDDRCAWWGPLEIPESPERRTRDAGRAR